MYNILKGRACEDDRRILCRPEIRRHFIDSVSEGLRPGIHGVSQEMRIFLPLNVPFHAIEAPVMLSAGQEGPQCAGAGVAAFGPYHSGLRA